MLCPAVLTWLADCQSYKIFSFKVLYLLMHCNAFQCALDNLSVNQLGTDNKEEKNRMYCSFLSFFLKNILAISSFCSHSVLV